MEVINGVILSFYTFCWLNTQNWLQLATKWQDFFYIDNDFFMFWKYYYPFFNHKFLNSLNYFRCKQFWNTIPWKFSQFSGLCLFWGSNIWTRILGLQKILKHVILILYNVIFVPLKGNKFCADKYITELLSVMKFYNSYCNVLVKYFSFSK